MKIRFLDTFSNEKTFETHRLSANIQGILKQYADDVIVIFHQLRFPKSQ